MVQKKQQVQVKKVSPYPFEGQLDFDGKKVSLQVDMINQKGFIAHIGKELLKAGKEGTITLQLPVHGTWVIGKVKIMKTYDRMAQKNKAKKPSKSESGEVGTAQTAPESAGPATVIKKIETPLSKLQIVRLAEFLFLNLSDDHKANIVKFNSAIGQE